MLHTLTKVHCEWSEWKIGKCDKACGGGHRTNIRSLKMDAKYGGKECSESSVITEPCNIHECAGKDFIYPFSMINFSSCLNVLLN